MKTSPKKLVKENNPETRRQKELRKWTLRFINRYREALEALARK